MSVPTQVVKLVDQLKEELQGVKSSDFKGLLAVLPPTRWYLSVERLPPVRQAHGYYEDQSCELQRLPGP